MKFKSLYKDLYDDITPGNDLITSIQKMAGEKKNFTHSYWNKLVPAAASLLIITTAVFAIPYFTNTKESNTAEIALNAKKSRDISAETNADADGIIIADSYNDADVIIIPESGEAADITATENPQVRTAAYENNTDSIKAFNADDDSTAFANPEPAAEEIAEDNSEEFIYTTNHESAVLYENPGDLLSQIITGDIRIEEASYIQDDFNVYVNPEFLNTSTILSILEENKNAPETDVLPADGYCVKIKLVSENSVYYLFAYSNDVLTINPPEDNGFRLNTGDSDRLLAALKE